MRNRIKGLFNYKLKISWLLMGMLIFAVIRHLLVTNLFILAAADQAHDDYMMVDMAESILSGKWLGAYTKNILVKGAFFPLLLAFFNVIGLSFIDGSSILYAAACIIFCYGVKPLFKKQGSIFILYLVLLFNPVSYAFHTAQRVYRNGVTLSQVLIVFGCLIGIYLRRKEKAGALVKWAVGAGLGVATLWHTREDGIWIIPFLAVATGVILWSIIPYIKAKDYKKAVLRGIIFLIPLGTLIFSNLTVSAINYYCYGVFTYNEINDSNFGKAMKSIYSVKNNEEIQYVSVTREKIKRIYEISPTFADLEPYMEDYLDAWDMADRTPGDSQVEDGWFFWCLRDAVNAAGYHSDAKTANEIYGRIASEIQTAVKEKRIEGQATMPSALMSPWRKGYTLQLAETMAEITKFVVTYDTVSTVMPVSNYPDLQERIKLFEAISNNTALYPESNEIHIKGWYANHTDNTDLSFALIDNEENIITEIEKLTSPDIKDLLDGEGFEAKGSGKVRFEITWPVEKGNALFAVTDGESNILEKISLDQSPAGERGEERSYMLDEAAYSGNNDIKVSYGQKYVDRLNVIGKVYQKTGVIICLLGVIGYIYLLILNIRKRKEERTDLWNVNLTLTSILLSLFVLFGGVAYNHIASCNSILYLYLSGSYPLVICFSIIAICAAAENMTASIRNKNR